MKPDLHKASKKTCSGCKKNKSVSEFGHLTSHGYQGYCKNCMRLHRKNNRVQNTSYTYRKKYLKKYYEKNKEKLKARAFLAKVIKKGEMVKSPCETCGNLKSEAHHYLGYDKPHWLDVKWLCHKHHIFAEYGYET